MEGKDVRLVSYSLYDDNQTARIFFFQRAYDIPYSEMPKRMQEWIPVSDGQFQTTYDHISAESGLVPSPEMGIEEAKKSTKGLVRQNRPTPKDIITSMFVKQMPKDLLDIGKVVAAAENAILNLKNPVSGVNGQAFINQANAIANLLDKVIKAKKLTIDEFNLAVKIVNAQDLEDLFEEDNDSNSNNE